jgi:hypothetical protein
MGKDLFFRVGLALFLFLVSGVSESVLASTPSRFRQMVSTPVITAAAYAQGDQIGTYTKLDGILPTSSAGIELSRLVVVDNEKAKHDLQLLIFDTQPTLASADSDAVSFTDAVASADFIGRIAIAEADYVDTASNSQAFKSVGAILAGIGSDDLWYVLVCVDSGGCDYGAVGDLTFKFLYEE